MGRCTGIRCPAQVGYDVANCNQINCIYRTEVMTNYDRIKSMSVLEIANFLSEIEYVAVQGKSKYPHEWEQWLLQEVSEDE